MTDNQQVEVDLGGQLDGDISQDITQDDKQSGGMSLPVSMNVSQPIIREWLSKRRTNFRPLGTFFKTTNFQVPPSAGRLSKRLVKNLEYFQSNYMLVFLVLVLYCLISSPLLLLVIAAAGGACYYAGVRNQDKKTVDCRPRC